CLTFGAKTCLCSSGSLRQRKRDVKFRAHEMNLNLKITVQMNYFSRNFPCDPFFIFPIVGSAELFAEF
ncbi:MAG TPA: hypothetical protein VFU15_06915, partial [Bacteroidia bacterium]|nr:hypothetical protein [Bacteroidia bacterium]